MIGEVSLLIKHFCSSYDELTLTFLCDFPNLSVLLSLAESSPFFVLLVTVFTMRCLSTPEVVFFLLCYGNTFNL